MSIIFIISDFGVCSSVHFPFRSWRDRHRQICRCNWIPCPYHNDSCHRG